MGGGDLNLKKSWHPNTMKNIEKVWKAEQRLQAEEKKIKELQRELQQERDREEITNFAEKQGVIDKKDGSKLDWMYRGPGKSVDREQYLLGKAVDKPLEEQVKSEKTTSTSVVDSTSRMHPEYDGIPTNILKTFGLSGTGQVDTARKLMEDPLSAIRKREVETRTELLSNPVRMKQLKEMLKEKQKLDKGHKKHKKEKKHKKSKHEDDADDLDQLLAAKFSKLKQIMDKKELKKVLEEERKSKKSRKRSRSPSSEDERPRKKEYGLVLPANYSKKEERRRSRSQSPARKKSAPASTKSYKREPSRKLTDEEKAAKLREMQSNANWRDEERSRNVKRYRDEEKLEKDTHKDKFDNSFINKQLARAAEKGTVEDRIRSNKNYIQRSSAAMDKNFARR